MRKKILHPLRSDALGRAAETCAGCGAPIGFVHEDHCPRLRLYYAKECPLLAKLEFENGRERLADEIRVANAVMRVDAIDDFIRHYDAWVVCAGGSREEGEAFVSMVDARQRLERYKPFTAVVAD